MFVRSLARKRVTYIGESVVDKVARRPSLYDDSSLYEYEKGEWSWRKREDDDSRDHEIYSAPFCRYKERARGVEPRRSEGRVNTKSNKQGVVTAGRGVRMDTGFSEVIVVTTTIPPG